MTYWIVNIAALAAICILLTGFVIPQILLIAFRRHLFDEPDGRKIHHSEVPRLGGIAFKPVIFFAIALMLGINIALGYGDFLSEARHHALPISFGFCSIIILYLVGIADDLIGVRYRAKFFTQMICGIMLIAGGVWLDDLHGILSIHSIPEWLGYPLTLLVIVFIINAINLIDGIDGLASGLCSIAFLFYGVSFFMYHYYFYSMLSFAALGVLIPFFCYNVFGNPERQRKIFMGDTGSLTIGMLLCFLSIELAEGIPQDEQSINPMALAFVPMFIPCFDVIRVFMHRIRNNENPFMPDQNHIHHKLLALGLNQRRVMVSIVAASLLFTLLNIYLSMYLNINWIFFGSLSLYTIFNIWLTGKIKKSGRKS